MLDVIRAVEGPYQLSRCLEECGECNRGASGICAFQQVFRRISEQVNRELGAVDSPRSWQARTNAAENHQKDNTGPGVSCPGRCF